jgi:hypothetical protein
LISRTKTQRIKDKTDPTLRRAHSEGNEESKWHVINSKHIFNKKSFNTMLSLVIKKRFETRMEFRK